VFIRNTIVLLFGNSFLQGWARKSLRPISTTWTQNVKNKKNTGIKNVMYLGFLQVQKPQENFKSIVWMSRRNCRHKEMKTMRSDLMFVFLQNSFGVAHSIRFQRNLRFLFLCHEWYHRNFSIGVLSSKIVMLFLCSKQGLSKSN
jgi:hypothetical protein